MKRREFIQSVAIAAGVSVMVTATGHASCEGSHWVRESSRWGELRCRAPRVSKPVVRLEDSNLWAVQVFFVRLSSALFAYQP